MAICAEARDRRQRRGKGHRQHKRTEYRGADHCCTPDVEPLLSECLYSVAFLGHTAAPPTSVMNSRRLIAPRSLDITSYQRPRSLDITSYQLLHVLRKGRCPLWVKSGSVQTECLLWAKSRHVRRTCRSILLLLQHTHLRNGNGPPFLPSAARPALRIRASSSPCHLASSFLVRWPSPLLMQLPP